MDRREALAKLAGGGAAVVGASLVVSSPAFAFAAPTVTGVPSAFTLTKDGPKEADIAASGFPAGSCPQSSTSPGDVPSQGAPSYAWTAPGSSGIGTTVTPSGNWSTGDTVTVAVTVAYTCLYAPPNSTTRSFRWTRTFTAAGPGASQPVFTGGPISGPTPV
jgi:hypothetical protein